MLHNAANMLHQNQSRTLTTYMTITDRSIHKQTISLVVTVSSLGDPVSAITR